MQSSRPRLISLLFRSCLVHSLLQDIRFSYRQLVKRPGFTLTAVLSLMLGIGATTAVFSVVHAILMDPYPYADSDRMIHLRLLMPNGDIQGYLGVTGSQWQQLRKSPVVENAFLEDDWSLTLTGGELPEDVQGVYLTSNAFQFLGVPAALGRGLLPSDAIDGQDPQPVVVLGNKFWQRHYRGDPAVVGRTIQLMRRTYTIVGVAAPRFAWGDGDVYLPLKVTNDPVAAYYVGTRLKPGVTHAQANAALQPLIQQFARETPRHFPSVPLRLHVEGLNDKFVREMGGTIALLFGSVALLLLIGCGNVSILLLARATAREQEFAIRSAIGASRTRIIRQLLAEALMLSLTGAALGLGLAYKLLAFIVQNLPEFSFPHEAAIRIDVPVLVFCVFVAVFTGVLFGLWPAWQLSRPQVNSVLQSGTRRSTQGARSRRIHSVLIGVQIALTLLMLAGAGAAIEGFVRIAHRPLGYDPKHVMSVGIPIHDGTYKTWAERAAYFQRLHDASAGVPGVVAAAISTNATPPSNGFNAKFQIIGKPAAADQTLRLNLISREYFLTLKIPLVRGRLWDGAEEQHAAAMVVVNQTFARRYFPSDDPVGHSIKVPDLTGEPPYVLAAPGSDGPQTIIGVVADKLDDGLSKPVLPEAYFPYTTALPMHTQLLVRAAAGSPLTLLHDRDQQTSGDVRDLEQWIQHEPDWARGQLVSWLFGAFAGLALALAAVGLYSVVSYLAAQRTNEFGIRMALGAERSDVLGIVFRSTAVSVGAGVAAGLVLTVALNRVLAAWSAESARDPLLLAAATVVLALVATAACALPAWRAAGVDPMNAIRYE
jgi:putative ABC transport system permease protein